MWLICERDITIIIILYCYSNKCENDIWNQIPKVIIEFAFVTSQILIKDNEKLLMFHLGKFGVLGRSFEIFWAIYEYEILVSLEFEEI